MKCTKCGDTSSTLYRTKPIGNPDAGWMCEMCINRFCEQDVIDFVAAVNRDAPFIHLLSKTNTNERRQEMKSGIELISAERQRQITEEGWTSAHDDTHTSGDLPIAAACYAIPPGGLRALMWPFDFKWLKETPNDRVKELVKAGALIAAEIDRIQRLEINKASEKISNP